MAPKTPTSLEDFEDRLNAEPELLAEFLKDPKLVMNREGVAVPPDIADSIKREIESMHAGQAVAAPDAAPEDAANRRRKRKYRTKHSVIKDPVVDDGDEGDEGDDP